MSRFVFDAGEPLPDLVPKHRVVDEMRVYGVARPGTWAYLIRCGCRALVVRHAPTVAEARSLAFQCFYDHLLSREADDD